MAALVLGWAVFDLLVMVVALRPWRGPDARRPAPWIAALVFLAWVLIDGGRTYAYLIAQGSWTAATILIPYVGVKGLVFGFLAWAALYSAGVARHRIKLCTDQPVKALWETVGACGHPPKDGSYDFAVYAIILLALAWVLVPLAIWLVVAKLN